MRRSLRSARHVTLKPSIAQNSLHTEPRRKTFRRCVAQQAQRLGKIQCQRSSGCETRRKFRARRHKFRGVHVFGSCKCAFLEHMCASTRSGGHCRRREIKHIKRPLWYKLCAACGLKHLISASPSGTCPLPSGASLSGLSLPLSRRPLVPPYADVSILGPSTIY